MVALKTLHFIYNKLKCVYPTFFIKKCYLLYLKKNLMAEIKAINKMKASKTQKLPA